MPIVNETDYYQDNLDWIRDPGELEEGLKHFYNETNIQPLSTSRTISMERPILLQMKSTPSRMTYMMSYLQMKRICCWFILKTMIFMTMNIHII